MLNKKQARQNLKQTRLNLAEQITALRRLHKMTVSELACQTGVPTSYIEKLELGLAELNLGNLHQIARAFDMKIDVSLEANS